jgi:enterochelin esterase-like enzyme
VLRPALRLVCASIALVLWLSACARPAGPPAGDRTIDGQFRSAALDGTAHFSVYLPRGYDSGQEHYPVIYFLHGLPAQESEYRSNRIAAIGRAADARGDPAIVVGVQGARAGDSDPEWHDWGPGRDWEKASSTELVRYIDRHFRTIPNRRARALIGLSAGGYGATIIAIHHPDLYSVVESWSGYFHATDPDGTTSLDLGSPEENQKASAHTYVRSAKQVAGRYEPFTIELFVGDGDSFLHENEQLDAELTAAGVEHVFVRYPGSHSTRFWDEHQDIWVADAVVALDRAG